LHRYLADGFGHKDHGSRHYHHDRHGYQRHQYAADACLSLEHTHESLGIAGDDTGKDDQGYSVADAMFGDVPVIRVTMPVKWKRKLGLTTTGPVAPVMAVRPTVMVTALKAASSTVP